MTAMAFHSATGSIDGCANNGSIDCAARSIHGADQSVAHKRSQIIRIGLRCLVKLSPRFECNTTSDWLIRKTINNCKVDQPG